MLGRCRGVGRRAAGAPTDTPGSRDVELSGVQSAERADARRRAPRRPRSSSSAFASRLQVALANTDGCPVRPPRRHPGHLHRARERRERPFAASGSNTATVGADASGNAVRADVHRQRHRGQLHGHRQLAVRLGLVLADQHRRRDPGEDRRVPPTSQSATVEQRLPAAARGARARRAAATPSRARRSPSRSAPRGSARAARAARSASAPRAARASPAAARRRPRRPAPRHRDLAALHGQQRRPAVHRDRRASGQRAPARQSGTESAGASGGSAGTRRSFALANLAGKPATITPASPPRVRPGGERASRSRSPSPSPTRRTTPSRARSSRSPRPRSGASGSFTPRSRLPPSLARLSPRTVTVRTDAGGIAVAPAFTANHSRAATSSWPPSSTPAGGVRARQRAPGQP